MYRFDILDVFTDRALAGNQLAVFGDATAIPEALLLPLAREVHFSETVFAYPPDGSGDVRIRIFTPGGELPFAGHPVLGSAVALAAPDHSEIRLETGRGIVPVTLTRAAGRATFGWMVQPLPTVRLLREPERLLAALGLTSSALPVELYDNGVPHILVALESVAQVADLEPNMAALARSYAHIGVNCFAGDGRHWTTRMFDPGAGIPEDPATGSAAGPLAAHLARHGLISFGDEIEISQGKQMHRPSTLFARVEGTPDELARVEVGGYAVPVGRGEFDLD